MWGKRSECRAGGLQRVALWASLHTEPVGSSGWLSFSFSSSPCLACIHTNATRKTLPPPPPPPPPPTSGPHSPVFLSTTRRALIRYVESFCINGSSGTGLHNELRHKPILQTRSPFSQSRATNELGPGLVKTGMLAQPADHGLFNELDSSLLQCEACSQPADYGICSQSCHCKHLCR